MRVLQTYIHSDHRIVNDLPNYIKGGLIKTHDDSHADFLVAYKVDLFLLFYFYLLTLIPIMSYVINNGYFSLWEIFHLKKLFWIINLFL